MGERILGNAAKYRLSITDNTLCAGRPGRASKNADATTDEFYR
jgi:hypothetical protein